MKSLLSLTLVLLLLTPIGSVAQQGTVNIKSVFDTANTQVQVGDATNNAIRVNIVAGGAAGGGTSSVDEAAFSFGVTSLTLGGGIFQTTPTTNVLTSGQGGAFQVTAQRALFVNLRDSSGREVGSTSPLAVIDTALGIAPGSPSALQKGPMVLGAVQAVPVYSLGGVQPLSLTNLGELRTTGQSNQGTPTAIGNAWPVKVTDGTNTMPTGDAVGRTLYVRLNDGTNNANLRNAAPTSTDYGLVVRPLGFYDSGGTDSTDTGVHALQVAIVKNTVGSLILTDAATQTAGQANNAAVLSFGYGYNLTNANWERLTSTLSALDVNIKSATGGALPVSGTVLSNLQALVVQTTPIYAPGQVRAATLTTLGALRVDASGAPPARVTLATAAKLTNIVPSSGLALQSTGGLITSANGTTILVAALAGQRVNVYQFSIWNGAGATGNCTIDFQDTGGANLVGSVGAAGTITFAPSAGWQLDVQGDPHFNASAVGTGFQLVTTSCAAPQLFVKMKYTQG